MIDARPALLLALSLAFSGCAQAPAVPHVEPCPPEVSLPAKADNVVLVTIDGVRWQEIFLGADPTLADGALIPEGEARSPRGLTPHMHHMFFDEGTVLGDPRIGEPLRASGPNYVSLPGYVEIMTGAASGCADNDCRPDVSWAVAGEAARGSCPAEGVAVFSSWERVARALPEDAGLVVHAGRDRGEPAPPFPGNGDYRPDQRTAALAIEHLVHHRPRFLWVALGDTDEWAHRGDYRGYLASLRFADDLVGEIFAHLAQMGDYGARTAVFVTTDHGRDDGFASHGGAASAGVWLMARGGSLGRHGVAALGRRRYLRDIAPTIAALLGEPMPPRPSSGEVLDELL